MLIAPWNEIWIPKEVAMRLSKQMFARTKRMRKRGHRAYAMFLRRDAKMVAQLEDGLTATRIELGMAITERAVVVMKYEQLEAELLATKKVAFEVFDKNKKITQLEAKNDALRKYTLALMTGPYIGMDREQRELILESELIALTTKESEK